jgi:hypothetical protein
VSWIVRWRALEERFASQAEALDRWEQLDALGCEPELLEVSADGRRMALLGPSEPHRPASLPD